VRCDRRQPVSALSGATLHEPFSASQIFRNLSRLAVESVHDTLWFIRVARVCFEVIERFLNRPLDPVAYVEGGAG